MELSLRNETIGKLGRYSAASKARIVGRNQQHRLTAPSQRAYIFVGGKTKLVGVYVLLEKLALASARNAQLLDSAHRSDEVALVMAVALVTSERGVLTAGGSDVRGHLFFKDLFGDGFNAFTNTSFNILVDSFSQFSSGHLHSPRLTHNFTDVILGYTKVSFST